MKEQKNIQISVELFTLIRGYFLFDRYEDFERIKGLIESKCEAMLNHNLYSIAKTEADEEKREAARKWYLDRKGVPDDFRY